MNKEDYQNENDFESYGEDSFEGEEIEKHTSQNNSRSESPVGSEDEKSEESVSYLDKNENEEKEEFTKENLDKQEFFQEEMLPKFVVIEQDDEFINDEYEKEEIDQAKSNNIPITNII